MPDKTIEIPIAVYDAMQTELHDLRQLIAKIANQQELQDKKRGNSIHPSVDDLFIHADFYAYVATQIAEYRKKDYR